MTGVPGDAPSPFLHLLGNHPNPFNPLTVIRYQIPATERVTLQVFDLAGRLVKTLVAEQMPVGRHEAAWNGQDQTGRQVSAGVYFYRLEAGDFCETKRMALVK